MSRSFHLARYPETLAVVRLAPGAEIPEWAESSSVFSITATAAETSLICAGRSVPKKAPHKKPFTAFCVTDELAVDEVVEPAVTRTTIARAIEDAVQGVGVRRGVHGNIPL